MKSSRKGFVLLCPLILSISLLVASESDCGSLVTYHEFSDLLKQSNATCFRNGCGNLPATSISSQCLPDSPCFVLWNLLLAQFQPDWCASCRNDPACRVRGWPVLNATAACSEVPNEWLFSAQGDCCASGEEPYLLADWINSLCNGSQWRVPFAFYNDMAKEDWDEWRQPWNWTVPAKNTSVLNVEQPQCAHTWAFLQNFLFDNVIELLAFAIGTGLTIWAAIQRRFEPPNMPCCWRICTGTWYWGIVTGMGSVAVKLVANFIAANAIYEASGHQGAHRGEIILLLFTSPSLTIILCAAGFLIPLFDEYLLMHRLTEIRQYLARVTLSFATTAIILQTISAACMFRTARAGHVKGFYHNGSLTPYWQGKPAQIMYAGALLWTICFSPSFILLGLLGIFMAIRVDYEAWERIRSIIHYYYRRASDLLDSLENEIESRRRQRIQRIEANRQFENWLSSRIIGSLRSIALQVSRRVLGVHSGATDQVQEEEDEELRRLTEEISEIRTLRVRLEELYHMALDRTRNWTDPAEILRILLTFLVLDAGIVAYICQWLFWIGFVESMGSRYV